MGTEKQVKLKRHDRKFSGNYVMTKSRKDLKMGDKWKKSMGVSEEVQRPRSAYELVSEARAKVIKNKPKWEPEDSEPRLS